MMKKLLFTIILTLSLGQIIAQEFKIIGYLPYYRFGLLDHIQMDKLTHLNIAFANPDMNGNLSVGDKDIQPIVEAAHLYDVKVLLSLAGGGLTADWAAAWEHLTKRENRSAFIHKLMNYTKSHDLEGLDVDLEWSHVDENYSGFVLELRDSLSAHDKLMTAALPGTHRYSQVTNEVIHAYDFINMMVYDLTGPWAPNNPGPHSPYSFAVASIQFWMNAGASAEKLTLGVPFYGWDFTNQNDIKSFTYGSMVDRNSTYADVDQVGQAYYNGRPTIRKKVELALEKVSGVMIWELGQDAFNEYSLLDVIHSTIGTSGKEASLNDYFSIGPNPFRERIHIYAHNLQAYDVYLSDLSGRVIRHDSFFGNAEISSSGLEAGFYILRIRRGEKVFSMKLVKSSGL